MRRSRMISVPTDSAANSRARCNGWASSGNTESRPYTWPSQSSGVRAIGAPAKQGPKQGPKKSQSAAQKEAEAFLVTVTSLFQPVAVTANLADWAALTDVTPEHTGQRTGADKALAAYRALKLRDYGRIDMRLSDKGDVYVIEANPNPWLSSSAEFAMAARKAGRSYTQLIGEIVDLAKARYSTA